MPLFLAHLMTTGLGPFYDGLAHLFVTPEDLLPVLALSLAAGLRGPAGGRTALFALPPAWLAGVILGRLFFPHWIWPVFSAVLTIAFGSLAAIDRKIPAVVVAVLAATLGLWNGSWNGIELARSGTAAFGTGLGIATSVFVVVALAGSMAAAVRAAAARIAARVAGSWIAAAGMFMLGWSLR
jgi:hydrogenase/urease accessory protein HupE